MSQAAYAEGDLGEADVLSSAALAAAAAVRCPALVILGERADVDLVFALAEPRRRSETARRNRQGFRRQTPYVCRRAEFEIHRDGYDRSDAHLPACLGDGAALNQRHQNRRINI